jgi:hypothetical protein
VVERASERSSRSEERTNKNKGKGIGGFQEIMRVYVVLYDGRGELGSDINGSEIECIVIPSRPSVHAHAHTG